MAPALEGKKALTHIKYFRLIKNLTIKYMFLTGNPHGYTSSIYMETTLLSDLTKIKTRCMTHMFYSISPKIHRENKPIKVISSEVSNFGVLLTTLQQ